jgi:propanol-preferring alcohol dehydrogenase
MRAWVVGRPGPLESGPLVPVDLPDPVPGPASTEPGSRPAGSAIPTCIWCSVSCRPAGPGTVPGHAIVGVVDATGTDPRAVQGRGRIGVAWLRGTCGHCRLFCRTGRENLCEVAASTRVGRGPRLRRAGGGA